MKSRLPAALLVLAIAMSGCGGAAKSGARGTASPSPGSSTKVSPLATPSETEEQRHEREEKALGYTPKQPPPTGFVPSSPKTPPAGYLTLAVRFQPTCVELGGIVRLTAKTNRPRVRVSFISTMANPEGRAVESDGRTDDSGLWEWAFVVPPNTAPRTWEMLGAALDDSKEPAGDDDQVLGSWFFVVARPGECA